MIFLKILDSGSVCSSVKASFKVVWVEQSGSAQATNIYLGLPFPNDPSANLPTPHAIISCSPGEAESLGAALASARAP